VPSALASFWQPQPGVAGNLCVAFCDKERDMKKPIFSNIGIEYSDRGVGEILGLPVASKEPIPDAKVGEIVIYYGGWDLQMLRTCLGGRKYMSQDQDWYDDQNWTAEPGYYCLLLPVLGSNNKNRYEQFAYLRTIDDSWQPAPVSVAATALLVHLAAAGVDLLNGGWCRCADRLPDGNRVALDVVEGRVSVNDYWDAYRYENVWLAGCRKC
jgi:hypothetical protein